MSSDSGDKRRTADRRKTTEENARARLAQRLSSRPPHHGEEDRQSGPPSQRAQSSPAETETDTETERGARERLRDRAKTAEFKAPEIPVAPAKDTEPRVLVVDDSSTFRRAIGGMLSRAGFQVDTANSGEEAFERCLGDRYAAVVSDITMGALSGVQLCRLLRSDPATKDMPVVLLTAADDPRSRFWGRNAGAAAYVAKERAREELVPEVQRVLARGAISMLPVHPRAGRRAQPMERLSQVLDELLFRAVVASEVQRLMHHTSDRQQFARELASLASDVADYAYLCIRLGGTEADSFTIHARSPFPAEPDDTTLQRLEVPLRPEPTLDVVAEGPALPAGESIEVRDSAHFPIVAAGEILGDVRAFGAQKRLGGDDRVTLELLAQQSALLVKNMRLLEETRRLANSDGLTGLQNRRRATERLETEMARARRYSVPLSLALCDVDNFKAVNDAHGHNMGDEVIKAVARALSDALRRVDLVGRWGGEEFLVLLPDTEAEGARVVAERMRLAVESLPPFDGGPERVTCSIGVASFRDEANSALFVDRADRALYAAKEGGRNRVELQDD